MNYINQSSILPWENSCEVLLCDVNCPKLSIVMPLYNSGSYLERTIRSLLFNDLNGVEIIIQDSCSTDESHSIIEFYKNSTTKLLNFTN